MKVEIHIESLRLEGVEAMTAEELTAAIEAELARLVEVWGVPAALREGSELRLPAATVRVEAGTPRREVGAAVARQLAGGWFGNSGLGDR